jgi:hypothetical protein
MNAVNSGAKLRRHIRGSHAYVTYKYSLKRAACYRESIEMQMYCGTGTAHIGDKKIAEEMSDSSEVRMVPTLSIIISTSQ